MNPEPVLTSQPGRAARENMDVVGEIGGVLDAVQVRGRRPGDQRVRRQLERCRPAGQRVVSIEAGVGVDVVADPNPGRAAELMPGEQAAPDHVGATEHSPRQEVWPVWLRRHADQPAGPMPSADTPVDNRRRVATVGLWTTGTTAVSCAMRDQLSCTA
ncbi:hypothetical protein [Micromonospora eburnea]|uniref:hypothetical protein n=1 Tax=Micromonospora eburnea TaxID=227316 RepID=UPI001FC9DE85|nr:hypothetical protein [Micromonospora eburnea]